MSGGTRLAWTAVVLVVPVIGPIAYMLAGGSQIPRGMRWLIVVGGLVIYLLLVAAGLLLA